MVFDNWGKPIKRGVPLTDQPDDIYRPRRKRMYHIGISEVNEDGPDRNILSVSREKLDLDLVFRAIFAPETLVVKSGLAPGGFKFVEEIK